jgi:hypothetical protein
LADASLLWLDVAANLDGRKSKIRVAQLFWSIQAEADLIRSIRAKEKQGK